ncbi:MAG: 50S ribosomal protein L11 methyltransferase, partial [Oscillospiraceae bacterium]|nr:50S ribosomal protein L11 methyltransferase [Oscillospiraceae bacterium]
FMSDNAVFIASGIIDGREDEVLAALQSSGFTALRRLHEEEWHCFVCR